MTRDDIIRMAREAGFITGFTHVSTGLHHPFAHPAVFSSCLPELERFTALVVAAEREACAQVCDSASEPRKGYGQTDEQWAASTLAERIRARGQA